MTKAKTLSARLAAKAADFRHDGDLDKWALYNAYAWRAYQLFVRTA